MMLAGTTQAAEATTTRPPISRAHMLAGASIGNALEFYDFLVYAFFASSIASSFFPGHDPATRLLLTFGTFGVSFLARPVGAVILGTYADRRGRTACMTLSVALMTLGGAAIAVMPSHAAIGLAAPFGILLARLIQGFSLGGEFGSSTAFMIEHSAGGEARAASWQGTSQFIAAMMASGVAWLLNHLLPPPLFGTWGFRIAFGIGVLAGPVALMLRRRLQEPPAFIARDSTSLTPSDGVAAEPATLSGILIAIGMVALGTGLTYLQIYLPTYATTHLHMTAGSTLGAVFLLYVALVAMTPLRLFIADRFDQSHHGGAMLASCLLLLVCGYPAFMLLDAHPSALTLFLLPVSFQLIGLSYLSPLQAFMGMVFSIRRRGVGLSVAYSTGVAIFGGFAPFINEWLVVKTGDPRSPGLYLAVTAVITMVALGFAGRRIPAKLGSAQNSSKTAR